MNCLGKVGIGLAVCAGPLLVSADVAAESIIVNFGGSSYTIDAGSVPGVFGTDPSNFTNEALNMMHDSLHGSGITTDGKVTIVAAQTDQGLSLMTLVDDNTVGSGFPWIDSILGVESNVQSDGSLFINDLGADVGIYFEDDGSQTALGAFLWDSDQYGDAIAWAGLDAGDSGSFSFLDISGPGLDGEDTFQFVTWNGSEWEVVGEGEFDEYHFSFTFAVVPLPAALGLGLVGLAGLVWHRRKQRLT